MLHASLSNLDSIDPRFLEPHASLVVMHQDVENELDQARLALDGLACLMESAANMNAGCDHARFLEVPPASMAALMRVVCDRIKGATSNPPLEAVKYLRPDLFLTKNQGA